MIVLVILRELQCFFAAAVARARGVLFLPPSPSDANVVGAREVRRGGGTLAAEGDFIQIHRIISLRSGGRRKVPTAIAKAMER